MRDKLTQAFIERAHAAPGSERTIFWDRALPGFGLMVTISEHKSFVFQYRIGHASRRMKLDGKFLRYERKREEEARKRDGRKPIERRERPGKTELDAARTEATMLRAAVKDGRDPLKELRHASLAGTNTLKSVCDRYLEAERKKTGRDKLRTLDQRRAMLERLVYPRLGDRPIHDIRRSDIVRLLDSIEERAQARGRNGAVMADRTLATVRKIMNWHATREDDFRSPIVRGMARSKPKERARERTLTDDELRAVWKAADEATGPFGAFVRFLLLTGARRSEAAAMARSELAGADWTLPSGRNKTKVDLVRPLSDAALAAIERLPRIGDGDLVFTTDGERPFRSFGRAKEEFDKACGVKGWTLHDLRRTARSLMSRAGVPSDHAERCLGHVMPGVRGIYDRHEYHAEKKLAFEKLAAQIARIIDPQPNVIQLARG